MCGARPSFFDGRRDSGGGFGLLRRVRLTPITCEAIDRLIPGPARDPGFKTVMTSLT